MSCPSKIICLAVTNRPQFAPWLLWSFSSQTLERPRRELVVLDSSGTDTWLRLAADSDEPLRVVKLLVGTPVHAARNRALEELQNAPQDSWVAWMDDDDWQHPERLQRAMGAAGRGYLGIGARCGWFVEASTRKAYRYPRAEVPRGWVFNSLVVDAGAAAQGRFPAIRRASDTPWTRALVARLGEGKILESKTPLGAWLCHGLNVSNPAATRRCYMDQKFTDLLAADGLSAEYIRTMSRLLQITFA